VICQKQNHGEFNVTPNDHINSGTGCPICKESKGEKFITQLLDNNNIVYTKQKRYNDCKGGNGKYSKKLPFDFYLLDNNILIEYDGRQHFQPVYGEEQLNKQKQLDNIKNQYCEKNNIKLIRIPYTMKNVDVELFLKQELNIV
jgi:very-short-patch-repair endonuclease